MNQETIDRIKAAIDVVDVVGDYVELKKRGASYVGLCPFHDDHSPSFYVSPSRGTWRCFVCDEGGDAISFVMKKEMVSFIEALKILARKYSIEIPERYLPKEEWIRQKQTKAMLAVNEVTMQYYEASLAGSVGVEYFRRRGFTDETMQKFHVGFAPERSDVIGAVKEKGLEMKYLLPSETDVTFKSGNTIHVENGVGTVKQVDGRFVDAFAGRVMFPWFNVNGKVVGFGGRKLDEATHGVEMKYRNSPDSIVYHKSRELWGLYQAKAAIARAHEAYMVEGYTDVMSLHQTGIENVVANSGTALSEDQVKLLARFAKTVTIIYDADKAGIAAANRAIPILLRFGINVNVVLLPEGEDPDSFCRQHSKDEVEAYLTAHKQDFVAFMNATLLASSTSTVEQAQALHAILDNIRLVQDTILRELFIKELAEISGIDIETIKAVAAEETGEEIVEIPSKNA